MADLSEVHRHLPATSPTSWKHLHYSCPKLPILFMQKHRLCACGRMHSLKYTVGKKLWTNVWVGTLHTHNPAETSAKASVGRNPYDSAPCREPSWFPSKHKLLFADREMTTPPGQPWPVAQCCRGWIRGEGEVWQRCFRLIAAKKNLSVFSLFPLTDCGVDIIKFNRLFELQDVVMFPQGLWRKFGRQTTEETKEIFALHLKGVPNV